MYTHSGVPCVLWFRHVTLWYAEAQTVKLFAGVFCLFKFQPMSNVVFVCSKTNYFNSQYSSAMTHFVLNVWEIKVVIHIYSTHILLSHLWEWSNSNVLAIPVVVDVRQGHLWIMTQWFPHKDRQRHMYQTQTSTLCIEYLPGTVTTSWSREQMHYLYIEIVVIVNN